MRNVELIISIASLSVSGLLGLVLTVIGFIGRTQIQRIDKHDDLILTDYKELMKDISTIKQDVAAIKAKI